MGDKTIREMKTAMQELFSQLEIEHPNLFNTNTLEGRKFINDYYKFFELEKNQIYNAFSKGMQEQTQRQLFKNPYKTTPEEYYNETFKNK
jgi:hypothetical protein